MLVRPRWGRAQVRDDGDGTLPRVFLDIANALARRGHGGPATLELFGNERPPPPLVKAEGPAATLFEVRSERAALGLVRVAGTLDAAAAAALECACVAFGSALGARRGSPPKRFRGALRDGARAERASSRTRRPGENSGRIYRESPESRRTSRGTTPRRLGARRALQGAAAALTDAVATTTAYRETAAAKVCRAVDARRRAERVLDAAARSGDVEALARAALDDGDDDADDVTATLLEDAPPPPPELDGVVAVAALEGERSWVARAPSGTCLRVDATRPRPADAAALLGHVAALASRRADEVAAAKEAAEAAARPRARAAARAALDLAMGGDVRRHVRVLEDAGVRALAAPRPSGDLARRLLRTSRGRRTDAAKTTRNGIRTRPAPAGARVRRGRRRASVGGRRARPRRGPRRVVHLLLERRPGAGRRVVRRRRPGRGARRGALRGAGPGRKYSPSRGRSSRSLPSRGRRLRSSCSLPSRRRRPRSNNAKNTDLRSQARHVGRARRRRAFARLARLVERRPTARALARWRDVARWRRLAAAAAGKKPERPEFEKAAALRDALDETAWAPFQRSVAAALPRAVPLAERTSRQ